MSTMRELMDERNDLLRKVTHWKQIALAELSLILAFCIKYWMIL